MSRCHGVTPVTPEQATEGRSLKKSADLPALAIRQFPKRKTLAGKAVHKPPLHKVDPPPSGVYRRPHPARAALAGSEPRGRYGRPPSQPRALTRRLAGF